MTRPRSSLLFLIMTVATLNTPARAGQSSPPSTLAFYVRQNSATDQNIVIAATPPGNSSSEFGEIGVLYNVLREGQTANSPVVGFAEGQVVAEKDLSLFISLAYVLNTTTFAGSITVQGVVDAAGNGEVAITGGTYDFRYAKGYLDLSYVSQNDPELFSRLILFHIKYD